MMQSSPPEQSLDVTLERRIGVAGGELHRLKGALEILPLHAQGHEITGRLLRQHAVAVRVEKHPLKEQLCRVRSSESRRVGFGRERPRLESHEAWGEGFGVPHERVDLLAVACERGIASESFELCKRRETSFRVAAENRGADLRHPCARARGIEGAPLVVVCERRSKAEGFVLLFGEAQERVRACVGIVRMPLPGEENEETEDEKPTNGEPSSPHRGNVPRRPRVVHGSRDAVDRVQPTMKQRPPSVEPTTLARRVRRRVLLLVLALSVAGCGRACKKEHPHVPYSVDDPPRRPFADAAGIDDLGPDAGARASAAEAALVAPAKAARWSVSGMNLVAPAGRELAMALVRDFDGDGQPDALAIVVSPASASATGRAAEIVHYAGSSSGGAPPVVVAAAPAFRADSSCRLAVRLERASPRSALAELGEACDSGGSSRALFVIRLGKAVGVAFDLGVMDPKGAPKLALDVDAADRDHDGIDDVTVRFTIEGGAPPFEPGPRLAAQLVFLDRPAGPSRDPDEPAASFRAIAALASSRAAKTKDAPSVAPMVQQMRMLFRALCTEGGAPRLVEARSLPSGAKGAIACGPSKALEDAGIAEVRAFAMQGDALRAVAAAETAQNPPATRTPARTAELATLLGHVAPFVEAKRAQELAVVVAALRAVHPEWGPVAFEPSGKLLVRTETSVVRMDVDTGESSPTELPAWGAQVLAPDGKSRWLEAYHACEGVALRATFAPTGSDGEMRDVLLPIAPPLGGRCVGGRGEQAASIPIAWGSRGLEVLVAGQPLLIRPDASLAMMMTSPLGESPPLGSPRSPGGRAMAVATSQGVLIRTTKAARYRSPELEPFAELRHCTVSDDASRIACLKRGRVVVASFDPM